MIVERALQQQQQQQQSQSQEPSPNVHWRPGTAAALNYRNRFSKNMCMQDGRGWLIKKSRRMHP